MSRLSAFANTTLRPAVSQELRSTQSNEPPVDSEPQGRSASLPDISSAIDEHGQLLPQGVATTTLNGHPVPALHFRKPSDVGLAIQTPSFQQSTVVDAAGGEISSNSPSRGQGKRRPAPLQPTPPPLVQRRSFGTPGASPASSASSPALAALGDVTPLPSPVNPINSPETWKKVVGRPHSGSSASLQRERASGLHGSPDFSPSKKKPYPNLSNNRLSPADDAYHNRSISEFVPDPLYNIRPRTVTGPSVVTASAVPITSNDSVTPLHREAYLARESGSADLTSHDAQTTLPSPPPSNLDTSDEDEESLKRAAASKFSLLIVHDQISRQPISWQPLRILGNGSFSEVFLATSDATTVSSKNDTSIGSAGSTRSIVAIKVVSHEAVKDAERMDTSIKREIEILQQVSHPSLPQLYAFEDNDARALLVMNYCAGGDLFELASQHRHLLRPRLIQRIFAELVAAVSYLHSQFIVHRDIKLENVLLNLSLAYLRNLPTDPTTFPHPVVTLTDLGLSKHFPPPPASALLTHPCGSIDYAAPEILLGQPYDGRATDTWALGVLLYALMEGRLPFDPLPEYIPVGDGTAVRRRRARGSGSSVKHRIARCDWLWCEFGDEDGDWLGGVAQSQRGRDLESARECVEGMLKKVGRGRWALDTKVRETAWVADGVRVEGGLVVPSSQYARS